MSAGYHRTFKVRTPEDYGSTYHHDHSLAYGACYQCGESVVIKRGKFLSIDEATETFIPHSHQPGTLANTPGFEDIELTSQYLSSRSIDRRGAW